MKKTTIILLILLFILCCTLSYAQTDNSFIFKTGDIVDLKVPCIKNNTYCGSSAVCNISILYPNGSTAVNNKRMTNTLNYHNYTLNDSTVTGTYESSVFCIFNGEGGYSFFQFMINNVGYEESLVQGIIYSIVLVFFVVIFVYCLFYAFSIESENRFYMGDRGDPLVEVEYGKYLKLLLFFIAYLIFWVITFLLWKIVEQFILTPFLVTIFEYVFTITTIAIVPIFIVVAIVGLMKHLTDSEILRLQKRGLRPR